MATIDSLDLATLTNNPQSIAEALEDALETTDGTIGQLKTDAQNKKDDIDDLYDSALTAKNAIDALLTASNQTESYYTNSFDSGFSGWDITSDLSSEHGLRIHRYGKLYLAHLAIIKSNVSAGDQNDVIKTLTSTNITLPSGDLIMGMQMRGTSSADDKIARLEFKSNGQIKIFYNQNTTSTFAVGGNFMGVDVS